MKLYKVSVQYETLVLAENPQDAIRHGNYAVKYEDEQPVLTTQQEITSIDEVPKEWLYCYPWNGKADKTVIQILEESKNEH